MNLLEPDICSNFEDGCPASEFNEYGCKINAPPKCAIGETMCQGGDDEKVNSKSIINLSNNYLNNIGM